MARFLQAYLIIFLISSPVFSHAAKPNIEVCGSVLSQSTDLRTEVGFNDIILIPLRQKHRVELKNLYSTPDVNRFFLGRQSADSAVKAHLKSARNPHSGKRNSFAGRWVIEFKGSFVGYLEMVAMEPNSLPVEVAESFKKTNQDDLYLSVGYALDPAFRGNGIATKALSHAIQFAKDVLKPKYIFASTNSLNDASQKVLLRNRFSILPTYETKRIKFVMEVQY